MLKLTAQVSISHDTRFGWSADISSVGTPVGDPIECESIRRTFGGAQRTELMYFGSVKDNIGHSEAASGAAATIKTILMMQKRTIPKQVNFSLLNIDIPPLALDQMCIPKQTQSWKSSSQRNAVINNYGAAGSNAAIVLQESVLIASGLTTSDQILVTRKQQDYPFIVAAKIFESLQFYCAFLRDMVSNVLETDGNRVPADFAYNLAIKQNYDHEYRWTTTSDTFRTLTYQLEQAAAGAGQIIRLNTSRRSVVLCFGGQTGRVVSISESLFYNCRLLQLHLVSYFKLFSRRCHRRVQMTLIINPLGRMRIDMQDPKPAEHLPEHFPTRTPARRG